MGDYKKVDKIDYVKNGIENGTMIPIQAEKIARIVAKQGNLGDTVITWSVDANGNPIEEKIAQVKLDPETNQPGWIVTKVDEEGNAIVDSNGMYNQWIIDDSVFKKRYEIDPENPILFKPKCGLQTFVEIKDNIILDQWGSEMKIAAGGFINITNIDDIYGISKRDFEDTYKLKDELEKKGHCL